MEKYRYRERWLQAKSLQSVMPDNMPKKTTGYDNQSISSLKGRGARPKTPLGYFRLGRFGGCEHSMFEILSNSIVKAREGFGKRIIVTRFLDKSLEIQDFGRGIRSTTTKKNNAITGSWFSASCTPAESTTTTRVKTMNTPSA